MSEERTLCVKMTHTDPPYIAGKIYRFPESVARARVEDRKPKKCVFWDPIEDRETRDLDVAARMPPPRTRDQAADSAAHALANSRGGPVDPGLTVLADQVGEVSGQVSTLAAAMAERDAQTDPNLERLAGIVGGLAEQVSTLATAVQSVLPAAAETGSEPAKKTTTARKTTKAAK